jgi:UMF1 family MFS transporter
MYDWANSSYSLVITSAIFPIYFLQKVSEGGSETVQFMGMTFNNASLLTYALSASFLVIAALSPLLSSLADYSGRKKAFMFFFCTLGAASCSTLFFLIRTQLQWVFGYMLAAIGFAGSIVFYNAFLSEIAAPKDQDRVSARGFAFGYIGSSLLLIFSLTMVMFPQWYVDVSKGLDAARAFASQFAFLLVGIWWFGFAQITFFIVPEHSEKRPFTRKILLNGYRELQKVWRIAQLRRLKISARILLLQHGNTNGDVCSNHFRIE